LTNPAAILRTTARAFVLSFACSHRVVYIINDIADREADRQHPTKRLPPYRRREGILAVNIGVALAAVL
jgi:4-hydroxybenzoate polyprenyltransferase